MFNQQLKEKLYNLNSKDANGKENQKEKLSFAQRLLAKILDNLELTVTNVHIRYEDSISIPDTTYAGKN